MNANEPNPQRTKLNQPWRSVGRSRFLSWIVQNDNFIHSKIVKADLLPAEVKTVKGLSHSRSARNAMRRRYAYR